MAADRAFAAGDDGEAERLLAQAAELRATYPGMDVEPLRPSVMAELAGRP